MTLQWNWFSDLYPGTVEEGVPQFNKILEGDLGARLLTLIALCHVFRLNQWRMRAGPNQHLEHYGETILSQKLFCNNFFKPQTWKIHVSITWENVKDFVIAFFLVLHVFLLYEKHNSHEKLYVNKVTNIILKTDYSTCTIKINLHFISRVSTFIFCFRFVHYFYQSQTELERTLLLLA